MDCFPSLLWPTRQGTQGSSQQVDTVIKVPDLLIRSLIPHKFHADWSTSRPGLGRLPQWYRQKNLSTSFCPHSVACRNISWRITDQWGAPNSHLGHSSRNNSVSSLHSASLNDSPTSIATSWQSGTYSSCPHNVVPINCGI